MILMHDDKLDVMKLENLVSKIKADCPMELHLLYPDNDIVHACRSMTYLHLRNV